MNLYKTRIKNVAIVIRPESADANKAAELLSKWFKFVGIKVFSHPDQLIAGTEGLDSPSDLQLVVALGGDGTYLASVRMLQGHRVPVIGFNLGNFGFLTSAAPEDIIATLKLAIGGKLALRTRSMVRINKNSRSGKAETFYALNDLVIFRESLNRLVTVSLTIDKAPITSVRADGLIVATPTGSSAYNLSAGGPLLHPEVSALVVTPICSHSLNSRPFIFPDHRPAKFTTDEACVFSVDGIAAGKLSPIDHIAVDRAPNDHVFLQHPGIDHFNVVKEKLKFGVHS